MTAKSTIGEVNKREIVLVTIKNKNGLSMSAMNYGATITKLMIPDKNGVLGDIAVGFESVDDYVKYSDNQGATIGRCANRLKAGTFSIDSKQYHIPCNAGNNMLHGNDEFRTAVWNVQDTTGSSVTFSYVSPDGSNGFPGKLKTTVRYTLTDDSLKIDYYSVCSKKTVINITNHTYFNLNADSEKTVYNHVMTLDCDRYTPTDEELIPTGEIKSVENTLYDFRTPKAIGKDINGDDKMLQDCGGYDVNFCVENYNGKMKHIAKLVEPESGRRIDMSTDLPGVQVYTGNWLTELTGKYSKKFCKHGAICLESQCFPDSPNHENFPQCIYDADVPFVSTTIYKFSVEK